MRDGRASGRSGRRAALALALAAALALTLVAGRAAGEPDSVAGSVELDAPVQLVWAVLTDFERWPGFVPGLLRLSVEPGGSQGVALRHETQRLGYRIDFTARTRIDAAARRLDLALDPTQENDLASMEASWQVTELPDGRVRVAFESVLESGQPVPRFLERRLLRESVEDTVESFRREVERRAAESQPARAAGEPAKQALAGRDAGEPA